MKKSAAKNQKNSSSTVADRPPVVAILGHVDHGKSTLLDYIRKTNIVDKEAGGITQHIGAYEVVHTTKDGDVKKITFLDTPGHAAFSGIRERGVKVADIAILIVSAEEGVKAQTIEALKAIQKESLPYIVAITKIDTPKADVERTKQSLAENEIYVEGYGGDIPCIAISAKTGEGIPDLLDLMLLVTEMAELSAVPEAPASGVVIEANRDTKKGITGTVIIQNGTLETRSFIVAGGAWAPVRIMQDFTGKSVTSASFSSPVKIIGWSDVPQVGLGWKTVGSKQEAEALAAENKTNIKDSEQRAEIEKARSAAPQPVDDLGNAIERASIYIILKADVSGSLEALEGEVAKIPQERLQIKVVQASIGTISESDVKVATGIPGTVILGFNVKIDPAAESLRERLGVQVQTFDIIYKLIEWVEEYAKTHTPKEMVEESTGIAKILKTFSRTKDKQIVGGRVEKGEIKVNGEVKIMRRELEIARGRIRGLQQQKEKATEVAEGNEFGAEIESRYEIMPGDKIECFALIER